VRAVAASRRQQWGFGGQQPQYNIIFGRGKIGEIPSDENWEEGNRKAGKVMQGETKREPKTRVQSKGRTTKEGGKTPRKGQKQAPQPGTDGENVTKKRKKIKVQNSDCVGKLAWLRYSWTKKKRFGGG